MRYKICSVIVFHTSYNVHFNRVQAASLHIWEKWTVKQEMQYRLVCIDYSCGLAIFPEWRGSSTGFNSVAVDPYTGEVTMVGPMRNIYEDDNGWIWFQSGSNIYGVGIDAGRMYSRLHEPQKVLVDTKNSYVGIVTGTTSYAYPNGRKHSDGYWYVYKGVNNDPTLTLTTANNQTLNAVG